MLFAGDYEGTQSENLGRALNAALTTVSLSRTPCAHYILGSMLLLMGDRESFYAAADDAISPWCDRQVEGVLGYWFVWIGRHEPGATFFHRAMDPGWRRGLNDYHLAKGETTAARKTYRKGVQPHNW